MCAALKTGMAPSTKCAVQSYEKIKYNWYFLIFTSSKNKWEISLSDKKLETKRNTWFFMIVRTVLTWFFKLRFNSIDGTCYHTHCTPLHNLFIYVHQYERCKETLTFCVSMLSVNVLNLLAVIMVNNFSGQQWPKMEKRCTFESVGSHRGQGCCKLHRQTSSEAFQSEFKWTVFTASFQLLCSVWEGVTWIKIMQICLYRTYLWTYCR